MDLLKKKCVPCEGGTPPLSKAEAEKLLKQVSGWFLDGNMIRKQFIYKLEQGHAGIMDACDWRAERE